MSPISSRNSVPPLAAWNRPGWLATAPVNAPLTWPNSSDSSRFSGIAPQFTATNGWFARALARWIACAISSLPLPLSPRISTLASDAATSLASASTSAMRFERLTISARQASISPPSVAASEAPSIASALAMMSSRALPSNGLVRYVNTPRDVASTASGMVPCAVSRITGSDGCCTRIASNSARPSLPGNCTSLSTSCGRSIAILTRASSADAVAVTR